MKKSLLLLLLAVSVTGMMQKAAAQCDSSRYYSKIFASYDMTSVVFTDTTVVIDSMDIYTPHSDTATSRRAILMIHGGSFIGGSRKDPFEVYMCEQFALRGYVTFSIDYRIDTANLLAMADSNSAYPFVAKSISDSKAAMRYLKRYASTLGIDTSWIVIGGESAGAIVADQMAYLTSLSQATPLLLTAFNGVGGTIEGNSGNPGYTSFGAKAVLDNAGAVLYLNFLNTSGVTTPIYMAQGGADGTVPYSCGKVLNGLSDVEMCGSEAMDPVLNGLGIVNYWHTFPGAGHCPWDTNTAMLDTVEATTASFLYNIACTQGYDGIKDISASHVSLYPNPASGQIQVQTNLEIETVSVIDAMGRVVSTVSASGTQAKLDISGLPSGIYMARIGFKDSQGNAIRSFVVE